MENKLKISLTVALIAMLGSCFFSIYFFTETDASTTVGSFISTSTWAKSGSPYTLIDNTTVSSISTLTIEAGVTVNLNGHSLNVNGALTAKGTAEDKVHFSGGKLIFGSNASGSILQNAVLDASTSLVLLSGSSLIDHNFIDTRIIVKGGAPTITNNLISDGVHADARDAPVTITNNSIGCKSGYTGIYIQGVHANVTGNRIIGNNCTGVYVYRIYTTGLLTENAFSNCSYALSIFVGPADDVKVTSNLFLDNNIAIYQTGGGNINVENNTFARNCIAVESYLAKVHYNNFSNSSQYNLYNPWLADVDATNNWWGSNSTQTIRQTLFHDDNYTGSIKFTPFLQHPNLNAPSISSNTTPAIWPTQNGPTIIAGSEGLQLGIILAVGFTIVLIIVAVTRLIVKHKGKKEKGLS